MTKEGGLITKIAKSERVTGIEQTEQSREVVVM